MLTSNSNLPDVASNFNTDPVAVTTTRCLIIGGENFRTIIVPTLGVAECGVGVAVISNLTSYKTKK